MRSSIDTEHLRGAFVALALAPLALYMFFFFEWLFLITGVSPLAAQPVAKQLAALAEAPVPLVWLLVAWQSVASLISILNRRLRFVALVPAAVILGLLGLLLIDNFTYTLFGWGIIRTGPMTRVIYVVALLILIVLAGAMLARSLARASSLSRTVVAGLAVLAVAGGGLSFVAEHRDLSEIPTHVILGSMPPEHFTRSNRPNILLISADAVDAGRLSAYGYPRPTTPFLESLRKESLFFENAFPNGGTTRASLVSLLTGRLATKTKVSYPPTVLTGVDSYQHLPAILKSIGYTTIQLGMRYYADAEDANMVAGFDAANYRWEDLLSRGKPVDQTGDQLRNAVLERVERRVLHAFGYRTMRDEYAVVEGWAADPFFRDERRVKTALRFFREVPEPWFIHVHLLDTHCCDPKPERIYFATGSADDRLDNVMRDGDRRYRTLVEALRSNDQLERTIVVFTADHPHHYGTTGRVPLMIRFPDAVPRDTVSTNVQLADVAPTLLDYLEIPSPEWMDGSSLLPPATIPPGRPIFGVAHRELTSLDSWRVALRNPGPPNYGATAVTMIAGAKWFSLDLRNGALDHGAVAGHTASGQGKEIDDAAAYRLMLEHIREVGYELKRRQPHAASVAAQ